MNAPKSFQFKAEDGARVPLTLEPASHTQKTRSRSKSMPSWGILSPPSGHVTTCASVVITGEGINTRAKRNGKVIRVSTQKINSWEIGRQRQIISDW